MKNDLFVRTLVARLVKNKLINEFSQIQSLEIITIKHSEGMVKLKKDWNQLLESSGQTSNFLSYAWQYAWWMNHARIIGGELSIVCVYSSDKLAAIVPLYIDEGSSLRSLRFIGQSARDQLVPICVQADIIIDICDSLLNEQIMGLLVQHFRGLVRRYNFKINSLCEPSPLYTLVRKLPKQYRLQHNAQFSILSIALPKTFECFIQSQDSCWLEPYRQYQEECVSLEGKLEYRFYTKPHEMYSGIESFSQISCSRQRRNTGGDCSFDSDEYMSFHESLSFQLAAKEKGVIASVILDGHLLASACYFIENKKLQIYQFAEIKNSKLGMFPAGLMLMLAIIEHAINDGYESISILLERADNDSEVLCIRGKEQRLYNVRWFKNRGRVYLESSVRKLYRALINR